jgi:hypothetical protein
MATGNDERVRSSLDTFVRGDWEAVSRVLDPQLERLF